MSESEEISPSPEPQTRRQASKPPRGFRVGGTVFFILIAIATISMAMTVLSVWGSFGELGQIDTQIEERKFVRQKLNDEISELTTRLAKMAEGRRQVEDLRRQLRDSRSESSDLQKTKNLLIRENADLEAQKIARDRELEGLKRQIANEQSEFETQASRLRDAQGALIKKRNELQKINTEIDDRRVVADRGRLEASEASRRKADKDLELKEIEQRFVKAEEQIQKIEKKKIRLNKDLASVEALLAGRRASIISAEDDFASYQSQIESSRSRAKEVRQELIDVNSELNEAKRKFDRANQDLLAVENDIEIKSKERATLDLIVSEIQQKEHSLSRVNEDLSRLEKEKAKIVSEIKGAREQLQNVKRARDNAAALKMNFDALSVTTQEVLNTLKLRVNNQEAFHEVLKKKITVASQNLAKISAQLPSLEEQISSRRAEASGLKVTIDDRRAIVAQIIVDDQRAQTLQKQKSELQAKITNLLADNSRLTAQKSKLELEIADLKKLKNEQTVRPQQVPAQPKKQE